MIKRTTLLHLRIPFSFFLLPVFLFALGVSKDINIYNTILAFLILHFFLYPASNAYNSYFDKDEGSIGGLENPPPVDKELYITSLFLDIIALLGGLLISVEFTIMLLFYGIASKAYSHPLIRLKKMAITGWLIAGFFQGFFTFMMVLLAVTGMSLNEIWQSQYLFPALLTTVLLWGSYPMTQIYQHEEDGKRGDLTISRLLGIRGTFLFCGIIFFIANIGFFYFYWQFVGAYQAFMFQLFLVPIFIFFIYWFIKMTKDISCVNYRMTMRLNLISATCMNVFFTLSMIHTNFSF
jgi:hypothetical protein